NRDWEGVFYPRGIAPRDYLAHYATRYRSVEVDSTWYNTPPRSTTKRWRELLPPGFILFAKIPRVMTHEKVLAGCEKELAQFLAAMEPLGDRLGPLLIQLPYFNRASGMTLETLLERLRAFLRQLPQEFRFALEIRNRKWLRPPLMEMLRRHGVALTLLDHPWMPRVEEIFAMVEPVTASFSYVRWLGDRRGIEKITRTCDRVLVDRSDRLRAWIGAIRTLLEEQVTVFGYFNNHYAGYAPGSIDLFERIWDEM
ncbi:MAG: DUF72 domain-containing protein, partial [Acidobacteriota bacterium]